MAENFGNEFSTTLDGGIDDTTTTITVVSATGAPAANFRIRVGDELMLVANKAGETWTVVRGVEGTTPAAHSSGAAATHVLTAGGLDAYVRSQETADAINPLLTGRRNLIINGDIQIDQANVGAAVTVGVATIIHSVDNFYAFGTASAGTFTLQRVASDNPRFSHHLAWDVGTADASLAAGDRYVFGTNVEGVNCRRLKAGTASAKTVTLSFEIKSSKTGTMAVAVRNHANNRSYVATFTIDAADTWEQKAIPIPLDVTGTWSTAEGERGLNITWCLASGSTLRASAADTWEAGNFVDVAGTTNFMDNGANVGGITGIQLELGSVATPFEYRAFPEELRLCQRYLEKSYSPEVALGTATTVGQSWYTSFGDSATVQQGIPIFFSVRKSVAPSVTVYSPATGAANNVRDLSSGVDVAGNAVSASISSYGFFAGTNAGGLTVNEKAALHWVAVARLIS